jgi:Periplasmic protein involved in polysaccharide export
MHRTPSALSFPPFKRLSTSSFLIALLCGCATLPSSGPTGREIQRAAQSDAAGAGFDIVPLNDLSDVPAPSPPPPFQLPPHQIQPTNLIGTGDVLEIAIYEAGVALFQTGGAEGLTASPSERLPLYRVDSSGNINIPYAGSIKASGRTTSELEADIRSALRGMSENPQILVSIQEVVSNSIIIGGEIGRPGRLSLPTNEETLLDAIALAGGYRGEAKDLIVKVQRQSTEQEFRLTDLQLAIISDFPVQPGDRITLVREPLTFAVMGAPGRAQQFTFPASQLSLTEALAIAGGSNPNLGDPKAIFVFRFVRAPDGTERPVAFHINMMQPRSFFVSQRFAMRDKDLLYVGNAAANQPSKFIQILSQLFTPVILARQLTD